jgi:methylmalonyl-CoA/ethylmalonyl-CoA epimerase
MVEIARPPRAMDSVLVFGMKGGEPLEGRRSSSHRWRYTRLDHGGETMAMARILRIDHIAVAVKDVDAGIARYQKILGAELLEKTDLMMHGSPMTAAYLKVGDGLIVLDGAKDSQGFIAQFIEKRGEGLHHIAIAVDDLDGYVHGLEAAGVRIPHRESLGPLRREILLSPRDLCGVVVQVIEWKEGDAATLEDRIARLKRFLDSQADPAPPGT